MSFRIVEIIEARLESVVAKVSHQNNQITAVVANRQTDDLRAGRSMEAEIGYDKVLGWKVMPRFDPSRSGIWQAEDGIHLLGMIHSLLDFGDGKTIVDVYIQNGSEVFQVDLDAVGDVALESDSGLEITVGKLYIYPRE